MVIIKSFSLVPADLSRSRRRFFWVGLLAIAVGTGALFVPLLTSYAIETILGASLLAMGVMRIWTAWGERCWQQLMLSLFPLLAAAVMLIKPLLAMVGMGALLGVFFVLSGLLKWAEWLRLNSLGNSFWLFIGGLLDIGLGYVIGRDLYHAAAAPGVMAGVNMIVTGMVLIALSRSCGRLGGEIRRAQAPYLGN